MSRSRRPPSVRAVRACDGIPRLPSRGVLANGMFVFLAGTALSAAWASDPAVSISGGADESGHHYQWTVTNRSGVPVVFVEFPHAQGDLFVAPPGWTTERVNLAGKPVSAGAGFWRAEASSAFDGISQGHQARFSMRVSPSGAARGVGTVTLRDADGGVVTVPGIEVPVLPSTSETMTSLLALGVIFVVFVAVATWRGRQRRAVG